MIFACFLVTLGILVRDSLGTITTPGDERPSVHALAAMTDDDSLHFATITLI
jgi:hypothetical protein